MRKFSLRFGVVLTMLIVVSTACWSQNDYIPKSPTADLTPTAMSFQRYGDIPVSLYTGTPSISIPLATIKGWQLSIPISLSYHSGGVKPDERPGPTGLGWTLNLGGAITRTKRHFPDELDIAGFIYTFGLTETFDIHPEKIEAELSKGYGQNDKNPSILFIRDTEPDKFSFNFLGYSGFFMLNNHGEWVVSCDRPLKLVSHTLMKAFDIDQKIFDSRNSKVFGSFVLQGEDGTLYTFGGKDGGDYAIDLSINFMMQNSFSWEANAWYLTEIKHPNGECIKFSYIHPGFSATFFNNEYGSAIYNPNGSVNSYFYPSETQGVLMYPAYLKSVENANFRVATKYSLCDDLDYDDIEYVNRLWVNPEDDESTRPIYFADCWDEKDWKKKVRPYKLDELIITSLDPQGSSRTVKFDYIEKSEMRLMLSGLAIAGRNNQAAERYAFNYHRPEKMPRYLAKENDHWGYYNGIKFNIDSPLTSNASATKEQLFGSLREIIYPTGGKTVFEFEPNRYSRQAFTHTAGDLNEVEESLAGGLRIRRIINVPNDNTEPEVREFLYVRSFRGDTTGCKSSGILECPPLYTHTVEFYNGARLIEYSENPLTNIINPSGFHIGYQEVVEKNSSGGYRISKFSSAADLGYKDEAPIAYSINLKFLPVTSMSDYRGRLLSESDYNDKGKLLRRKVIAYNEAEVNKPYIHSLNLNRSTLSAIRQTSKGSEMVYMTFSLYKNYIFQLREKSEREVVYGESYDDTPFVSQRYFRYNDIGQIKCDSAIVIRHTKPSVTMTRFDYKWESDPQFYEKHFLSYPEKITRFNRGKDIGSTVLTYGLTENFEPAPVVHTVSLVAPNNKSTKHLYTCLERDNLCRPLLVKDSQQRLTAYLWQPFHFIPVAEIRLSKKADYDVDKTMYSSMPYWPEDLRNFITELRTLLPAAQIIDYTYSLMDGIRSAIDPSNRTTTFDYDFVGRLIGIRDSEGRLTESYRSGVWSSDN